MWRVAVAGLGHWYSAYNLARAMREYPKAVLVGVASRETDRREEFAGAFGLRGYDTLAEMFDRERVDIVHIASPVSEIHDLTLQSAAAGKHVVLGKPMAMSVAEADRMVAAVEAAGIVCVPLQGIMRIRFAWLKARIDAGEIGDVLVLHQASRWSIAEDWYRSGTPGWFADPRSVPGGAFIDEGIYWVDFFRWITGSEIVQVEAKLANLVHRDIAVEDWGMATFKTGTGVIATLEASWTINAPRKSGPSPKQNSVVRLEVVGSRGEIIEQWFRAPGRAVLASGAPDWVFERQPEEPFAPTTPSPLDHLIGCLEHDRPPVATIQDARRSLAAALAAYESARMSGPIRLSWPQ